MRAHFEGAHRVSIERRDENGLKRARVAREQLEARLAAKLNVEKHHAGSLAANQRFGFVDAAGLADHVDAALRGQQRAQRAAREPLVVHDHRSQRLGGHKSIRVCA